MATGATPTRMYELLPTLSLKLKETMSSVDEKHFHNQTNPILHFFHKARDKAKWKTLAAND